MLGSEVSKGIKYNEGPFSVHNKMPKRTAKNGKQFRWTSKDASKAFNGP